MEQCWDGTGWRVHTVRQSIEGLATCQKQQAMMASLRLSQSAFADFFFLPGGGGWMGSGRCRGRRKVEESVG